MKKKEFEKKPVKKKTLGKEISKKEKTKLKKRAFEDDDEEFFGDEDLGALNEDFFDEE